MRKQLDSRQQQSAAQAPHGEALPPGNSLAADAMAPS
jgi:hypothetical protein